MTEGAVAGAAAVSGSIDLHPRLSVSGISTISWSLAEDISYWQSAGVTRVGVASHKLAAHGVEAAARDLAAAGIAVGNVVGGTGFHVDRPEGWDDERAALMATVDAADLLGAPCVCTLPGPAGRLRSDEAVAAFAEAVGPVRDHADDRGVTLAVEHAHWLRRDLGFVHSLADAVDMARVTGTGVCVELNNAWVEMHLPATFRRGVDRFGLVQVSDFVVGTVDTPNRAVPGDGDIPLEWLLAEMLDAGYHGMFDLEIIGPRIEAEGYADAVRRGAHWLSDTLKRLGA